jgi:hypothetical protein
MRIWDGVGGEAERGGGCLEGVERRVGDEPETLFWSDPWLDGVPLSVRYRRLFELSLNKSCTVAGMRDLGWEDRGAAWV